MNGSAANDVLWGLGGDDVINGGDGDDVLEGDGTYKLSDAIREFGFGVMPNASTGNSLTPVLKPVGIADGRSIWQISNNSNAPMIVTFASATNGKGSFGPLTVTIPAHSDYFLPSTNLSTHKIFVNGTLVSTVGVNSTPWTGDIAYSQQNEGNDVLDGGAGNDTLRGYGGDDKLYGGTGTDSLDGGTGNDLLNGGSGGDKLVGGDGSDTADYSTSSAAVNVNLATGVVSGGDAQGDTLSSIENVNGSAFNDVLTGNASANVLRAGAGNDVLVGSGGGDVMDGGADNDTANYSASTAGVIVNLAAGTGVGGFAQGDTLISIENVVGSAFADTLTGDASANVLRAGAGDDLLVGSGGGDIMDGGADNDTANYSASTAGVTVNLAAGTGVGGFAQGDKLISIENVVGSAFADILTGDASANKLLAGTGNDVLKGGAGADVLDGGAGVDTADYSASSAAVTIDLATGLAQGGDAQGDVLTNIENLIGSAFNDVLTGDASVNVIDGGAGDDIITGGSNNDKLYGGDGNDLFLVEWSISGDAYIGGAGTDTFSADVAGLNVYAQEIDLATGTNNWQDTFSGVENLIGSAVNDKFWGGAEANTFWGRNGDDLLDGRGGDDVLFGEAGDDTLIGGAGADKLVGGDGIDTATYSASSSAVTVNLATGIGSGGDAQGDTLLTIENVVGSSFNDLLVSAAGANVLNGGAGVDTVSYAAAAAGVTVNLANGTASDGDTLVSIENAIGSAFDDHFISGALANAFNGGKGSDLVDYSASGSGVTVNLDSGNGLGGDAQGDSFADIENVLGSLFDDVLTGNASSNRLEGNEGNDILHGLNGDDSIYGGSGDDRIYGGAGSDIINGGAGTDTADYRYSAAAVNVSLVTNTGAGGEAEGDVLVSIENLAGSNFDDVLTGNEGVNRLVGNQGSDTMYGMGGNDMFDTGGGYDVVYGGDGIDTVTYDDSWGLVVVNLATGLGSGAEAADDRYFGVENVIGSLFGDRLTGDAGVNQLTGLDGNDVLDGGAGNDYLVGGLGADTLIGGAGDQDVADYDDAAAGVTLNLATGGTGGEAAGDTFSGIEYVYGSDFADNITGDAAVNRLLGNNGDDVLDGAAGNDILVGGLGGDTLIGGAGDQDAASYQAAASGVTLNLATGGTGGEAAGDNFNGIEFVYGSEYDDQITGDAMINRLVGGNGNDMLDGAGGNDYLLGDAGNDNLTGGAGADVYIFGAGFGNDTITDFWTGIGRTDRVWFQGVGLANYADVLAHASDSAGGVMITAAGHGSMLLAGVTVAQLNADDFLFG